ncbi:type IV pilus modification PilV family protein [Alicyclobacillus cellulosilyticus]|uniref:type IV pilus modification PilV family protein n=1 Tax=Alicyclobacillus cellulosilyticus TaxID=1003997 RepID=UPI001E651516|nr:hypothetical protein [Alicyclobacillus cellulosilyticus]
MLEVMASIVILAVTLMPVGRLVLQSIAWMEDLANQEQALAYAKDGVQLVRQQVWSSYQTYKNAGQQNVPWTPPSVTPPALPSLRGVIFTETISGPNAMTWGSSKLDGKLYAWTVTVSWHQPNTGRQGSVVLQTVIDPTVSSG